MITCFGLWTIKAVAAPCHLEPLPFTFSFACEFLTIDAKRLLSIILNAIMLPSRPLGFRVWGLGFRSTSGKQCGLVTHPPTHCLTQDSDLGGPPLYVGIS